jgi:hypothetical protein
MKAALLGSFFFAKLMPKPSIHANSLGTPETVKHDDLVEFHFLCAL